MPPLILYALTLVNFFGWYMVAPSLPLYLTTFDMRPTIVGAIIASSGFVPLLVALPAGAVADRTPARWLAAVGFAGMAGGTLVLVAARGPALMMVSQALHGLSEMVITLAVQAEIYRSGGTATRDLLYGRYTFWASVGQILAPAAAGAAAELALRSGATPGAAFRTVFLLAAALFGIGVVICLRIPHREAGGLSTRPIRWQVVRETLGSGALLPVLVAGAAMIFAFDVRRSFYPIYLKEVGLSPVTIGLLLSTLAVASALVRPFLPYAVRKAGHRGLLVGVLLLGGLGWAATLIARSWLHLALAGLLCGAAHGLGQPLSMAMVAGASPAGSGGLVLGIRQLFNRVGQALSPVTLGLVVSFTHGTAAAFGAAAAVLVLAAIHAATAARLQGSG